ncbi:unnamed protein product [Moneuplotes crassus]|uniref:Uncharacterized protein n=1 Tax=Euplotes crassus TaxID=5936 RepID=A0AAD2CYD0_EUPCR|nr:unnamed protein product [Moneuplotes crassus]
MGCNSCAYYNINLEKNSVTIIKKKINLRKIQYNKGNVDQKKFSTIKMKNPEDLMNGVTYKIKKNLVSSQITQSENLQKTDHITAKKYKIQEIGKSQEKESRISAKRMQKKTPTEKTQDNTPTEIEPRFNGKYNSNYEPQNDSIYEEDIQEDILQSPAVKNPELFDPFSGEKIHSRKKVYCSTDKELEESGSIFTGRDENKIMKLKRIRDAQAYQKILQQQINEKMKTKTTNLKKIEKIPVGKNGLKKISSEEDERLPAVVSSRYSNSNTACTRDLFTPSEENCLSQHLSNYANQKARVVVESDCIDLRKRSNSENLCDTVREERSREEGNTEESCVTFKSPNPKNNEDNIKVFDGDEVDYSLLHLEDVVGSLLKEQQNLKQKINEQEMRLHTLTYQENDDENEDISQNLGEPSNNTSKTNVKRTQPEDFEKKNLGARKMSVKTKKIKANIMNPISKAATPNDLTSKVPAFGKHKFSVQDTELTQESGFLEKAGMSINKNHNLASKSVGNKNMVSQTRKNSEPPNMKFVIKPNARLNRNLFKETFMSKIETERQALRNSNLNGLPHQFSTVDNRENKGQRKIYMKAPREELSLENRMKISASMQKLNLPQINLKRVFDDFSQDKQAYFQKQKSLKRIQSLSQLSSVPSDAQRLAKNNAEPLSANIEKPENIFSHRKMTSNVKESPYFVRQAVNSVSQMNSPTKGVDYQPVPKNYYYQAFDERDVLSSAYSSVASTIVPDYQKSKPFKSGNSKKSMTLKHISKKGKGGKRMFPKDFFSG